MNKVRNLLDQPSQELPEQLLQHHAQKSRHNISFGFAAHVEHLIGWVLKNICATFRFMRTTCPFGGRRPTAELDDLASFISWRLTSDGGTKRNRKGGSRR